jgi:hypothetical protein
MMLFLKTHILVPDPTKFKAVPKSASIVLTSYLRQPLFHLLATHHQQPYTKGVSTCISFVTSSITRENMYELKGD